MENTAGKIFTELKEDISTYARLKLRLLKLMAIERTAIVLAVLSHSLILLLLSFFTVLFLFVALGCYLGELLDSPALGFLIVGGFYLLFTLIVWGMKHGIRIGIMNMVIEALQANDDEDDKGQSQNPSRPGYPGEAGDPTAVSADWQYIRSHAGRLMWSEISAVLMPHRRNNGEKQGGPGFAGNPWINMAWQLGKPILYRWMGEVGWQVFKSMFCRRRAE